jgi:hypothetical protein
MQCGCNFYPIPPPASLFCIPEGEAGTRVKLQVMSRMVRQYKTDAGVRMLAQQLTAHLPSYDSVGEIRALHGFVRDDIRYVEDVEDIETIQIPPYTLEVGSGDCDDKVTCLCALLASIGYKCLIYCVGFDGGPHEHVLAGVYLGSRALPMETVIAQDSMGPGSARLGWMPPNADPIWPWRI